MIPVVFLPKIFSNIPAVVLYDFYIYHYIRMREIFQVQIVISGKKLTTSTSVFNSETFDVNGEVVTIDVPICSSYAQAQAIANNFIAETEERDEFELEIKRNILLECGDVLELEKPVFGSDANTAHLPCRLLENKKSLTKVRQNVKMRKLFIS